MQQSDLSKDFMTESCLNYIVNENYTIFILQSIKTKEILNWEFQNALLHAPFCNFLKSLNRLTKQ